MKIKFLKWIFFLVLIINANTMNAQNKSDTLSAQQQNLIAISALTATGDLENLKIQLNNGLDEGFPILL